MLEPIFATASADSKDGGRLRSGKNCPKNNHLATMKLTVFMHSILLNISHEITFHIANKIILLKRIAI
jgi:hypothetical protein